MGVGSAHGPKVLAAGFASIVGLIGLVWLGGRTVAHAPEQANPTGLEEPSNPEPRLESVDPAPTLVEDGPPKGSAASESHVGLEAAVEADDTSAALAAIDRMMRRQDPNALEQLSATNMAGDGYVAAKAIKAVAELGASGDAAQRERAAQRLATWFDSERKRDAPEALGNVSILAEEMGNVRSKKAIEALVKALDDGTLPLHIETQIVQSLAQNGATESIPALKRFADRIPNPTGADKLDDALRSEARAAVAAATAQLAGG